MVPYTIDDPITDSLTSTVEVTIDFEGHERWLFFKDVPAPHRQATGATHHPADQSIA